MKWSLCNYYILGLLQAAAGVEGLEGARSLTGLGVGTARKHGKYSWHVPLKVNKLGFAPPIVLSKHLHTYKKIGTFIPQKCHNPQERQGLRVLNNRIC